MMGRAAILFGIAAAMIQSSAIAACGDRGGPGYRGPNGKCVGWAALGRVCGNPPTTNCTAELVADGAHEAAVKGSRIDDLRDRAHQLVNPQK